MQEADNKNFDSTYRIILNGSISNRLESWMDSMKVQKLDEKEYENLTVIEAVVSDQSGLRGLMNNLWDLNLEIISVDRLRDYTENNGGK